MVADMNNTGRKRKSRRRIMIRRITLTGKIRLQREAEKIRNILKDQSGMSVIELLLILVVIIALVLIFKNQLTALVNTIFDKITSESAGI